MAEWLNAPDLKFGIIFVIEGSNPSLSEYDKDTCYILQTMCQDDVFE